MTRYSVVLSLASCVVAVAAACSDAFAQTVLVEAEQFADLGGWVRDS